MSLLEIQPWFNTAWPTKLTNKLMLTHILVYTWHLIVWFTCISIWQFQFVIINFILFLSTFDSFCFRNKQRKSTCLPWQRKYNLLFCSYSLRLLHLKKYICIYVRKYQCWPNVGPIKILFISKSGCWPNVCQMFSTNFCDLRNSLCWPNVGPT